MSQSEASRLHGCFKMNAPHKVVFVLLLAMAVLVACNNKKIVFVPIEPSAEKGSVLYVYRPSKTSNVMQIPKMSITSVKTFEISSGEYKQFYLSPGKYAVKLHAIKDSTEAVEHELLIEETQVYFLRVDASMKFEVGQSYQPYQRKFGLTEVSPEMARAEIGGTKDMDVRSKKKKRTDASGEVVEEDEATFSVDRTLNPFNH